MEIFQSVINDNIAAYICAHNGSNQEIMVFTGQEVLDLLEVSDYTIHILLLDDNPVELYEKAVALNLINGEGYGDYDYDCVQVKTQDTLYDFYVPRGGW